MSRYPINTDKLIAICRKNDAAMISLFGSMARGTDDAASDVDVLLRFSEPKSLLAIVRLERELSEALDRRVDIVTEEVVSPYLKPYIYRDLRVLYES